MVTACRCKGRAKSESALESIGHFLSGVAQPGRGPALGASPVPVPCQLPCKAGWPGDPLASNCSCLSPGRGVASATWRVSWFVNPVFAHGGGSGGRISLGRITMAEGSPQTGREHEVGNLTATLLMLILRTLASACSTNGSNVLLRRSMLRDDALGKRG